MVSTNDGVLAACRAGGGCRTGRRALGVAGDGLGGLDGMLMGDGWLGWEVGEDGRSMELGCKVVRWVWFVAWLEGAGWRAVRMERKVR